MTCSVNVCRNSMAEENCQLRTVVMTNKAFVDWEIANFSFLCKKPGEFIESLHFSTSVDQETKWRARLYPNGKTRKDNGLSLFVLFSCPRAPDNPNASTVKKEIVAKAKFSVISSKAENVTKEVVYPCSGFKEETMYGAMNLISLFDLYNKANGYLTEDTLRLRVTVEVMGDIKNDVLKTFPVQVEAASSVSEDLDNILKSRIYSDVTFKVGKERLEAHKLILTARSEVFAAMFKHEMQETNSNNVVEIKDIKINVFREMLRFIYTGRLPRNLDVKVTMALLVASDKYDLKDLKQTCESVLSSAISVQHAADILLLAHLHNAESLVANSVHFIRRHAQLVKTTVGWERLKHEGQELIKLFLMQELL